MSDKTVRSYRDIPGWFRWLDKVIFDTLLEAQQEPGDVVELGAYLGKSTVVLGDHIRPGERLVVVDLFGADPSDYDVDSAGRTANLKENETSYAALERKAFEANYLALHPELPEIVTGLSSGVNAHVPPQTVRFLHIDAGHLYANASEDVANSKVLLGHRGIVVFDDYRTEHTPGVAAAVWEAVVTQGLRPFALTPNKMYASYDDPADYRELLEKFLASDDRFKYEQQEIMGHSVLRARLRSQPRPGQATSVTLPDLKAAADDIVRRIVSENAKLTKQRPATPPAPPAAKPAAKKPSAPPRPAPVSTGRRLAKDLLPPALTRAIRRLRG